MIIEGGNGHWNGRERFLFDGLDEATILVKARLSVPASSS